MSVSTVFLVVNDASRRGELSQVLDMEGLAVKEFDSEDAFLNVYDADQHGCDGCIVLDLGISNHSALGLQKTLAKLNHRLPIVFVSDHVNISPVVQAMRAGAFDVLPNSVSGNHLIERVLVAMDFSRNNCQLVVAKSILQKKLQKLTEREREVLMLALTGMPNKEISKQLQVSPRTIEGHRSRIHLKTGIVSLLELMHEISCAGLRLTDIASLPETA